MLTPPPRTGGFPSSAYRTARAAPGHGRRARRFVAAPRGDAVRAPGSTVSRRPVGRDVPTSRRRCSRPPDASWSRWARPLTDAGRAHRSVCGRWGLSRVTGECLSSVAVASLASCRRCRNPLGPRKRRPTTGHPWASVGISSCPRGPVLRFVALRRWTPVCLFGGAGPGRATHLGYLGRTRSSCRWERSTGEHTEPRASTGPREPTVVPAAGLPHVPRRASVAGQRLVAARDR